MVEIGLNVKSEIVDCVHCSDTLSIMQCWVVRDWQRE